MSATPERHPSDFGREMLSTQSSREVELWKLRRSIDQRTRAAQAPAIFKPEPGVSIVVATHKGVDRLRYLLDSLIVQTLEASRFEVVIVENGTPDGTSDIVEEYNRRYPQYSFRYFWRKLASAGGARNLGIKLARLSRITFVDDDDSLEPDYLRNALSVSTGTNMVASPIINMYPDGSIDEFNGLNNRISMLRGSPGHIADLPWLLGFNACKLVPTWMIKPLRYRDDLKSGEDLVFWAQLLTRKPVEVVVAPGLQNGAYLRGMRDDSVSRQKYSRDFSITQRIECIRALGEIRVKVNSSEEECVNILKSSQAGFVLRYMDDHPDEHDSVIEQIERSNVLSFPWSRLNRNKATEVAFLYCFAPFADTSAVVASKAIAERRRITDVFTNDMSSVRKLDPAVSSLAERWIEERTMISAHPSFADWGHISDFATRAVESAVRSHKRKGGYSTVYSRALWIGSHVAAILFKLRYDHVEWTAEFSDPLRKDAHGQNRHGAWFSNSVFEELCSVIESRGYEVERDWSLFELVEVATFLLADKIVFTNTNQMDFMLSLTGHSELQDEVSSKSIVRPHPTPPLEAYSVAPTSYMPPLGKINIAYFGTFYPNRGIGDIVLALVNSSARVRHRVRLHVFSNSKSEVAKLAADNGIGAIVHSNDYLPYMEFLNATTKFDILLVNDVERSDQLPINPFLPSKLSDYRGAGRKIWAIVDEGSPMSDMKFDYVNRVGHIPGIVSTFNSLA